MQEDDTLVTVQDGVSVRGDSLGPIEKCARIELKVIRIPDEDRLKRGHRLLLCDAIFNCCNFPASTRFGENSHCYEYALNKAIWKITIAHCTIEIGNLIATPPFQECITEKSSNNYISRSSKAVSMDLSASMEKGIGGAINGDGGKQVALEQINETEELVTNYSLHHSLVNQLSLEFDEGYKLLGGLFKRELAIVTNWTTNASIQYKGNFLEDDIEILRDSTKDAYKHKPSYSKKMFVTRKLLIRTILDDLNDTHTCK